MAIINKYNTTARDIRKSFERATVAICDTIDYISAEDVEQINRICGGNVFGEINEILLKLASIECATVSAHKGANESIL